jgi:hypothetical protein
LQWLLPFQFDHDGDVPQSITGLIGHTGVVQHRHTTKILLDWENPLSSGEWPHEIEHDGFQKLYSRPGMIQTESLSLAKPTCYRNFPT